MRYSIFKEKIDKMSVELDRLNSTYTSGMIDSGYKYLTDYVNQPWIRSTLNSNALELQNWINTPDNLKIGSAVLVRTPDGTDYRIILNTKDATVSSPTGKILSTAVPQDDQKTGRTTTINAEVMFAAGKAIAPTVIARTYHQNVPINTLSAGYVPPPPLSFNGKNSTTSSKTGSEGAVVDSKGNLYGNIGSGPPPGYVNEPKDMGLSASGTNIRVGTLRMKINPPLPAAKPGEILPVTLGGLVK